MEKQIQSANEIKRVAFHIINCKYFPVNSAYSRAPNKAIWYIGLKKGFLENTKFEKYF